MSEFRINCPQCSQRLVLKNRGLLGRNVKCPNCGHRFALRESFEEEVAAQEGSDGSSIETSKTSPTPPDREDPQIDLKTVDESTSTYRRVTQRSRQRGRIWFVTALLSLVCGLGIGAFYFIRQTEEPPLREVASEPSLPLANDQTTSVPAAAEAIATMESNDPIQLLMIPSGARLILNFRPAELWGDDAHLGELRVSLTENVVSSVATFLLDVAHRQPEQIEEVLFAWILGARGTPPQLAVVVHLAQEERMSDLIEEFGAKPLDELAQPRVYLLDEQAVYIHDESTLAFAPQEMADEIRDWVDVPNPNTSDGILALLPQTDRKDLLTIICEPADLLRHVELLFPKSVHDVTHVTLSWFAEHAETIAWGIDTREKFQSKLLLRGASTQSASTLVEQLTGRLTSVPAQVLKAVGQLNPQRAGYRKLIGRFPAMLEVSILASNMSSDGRIVWLTTVLPSKAGPNLALASILTWAESKRASTPAASVEPNESERTALLTFAERLNLTVDAEFKRTPLQEAIGYIAGEIGTVIEIDGDALKDAGFTKNMPQTFNLGAISAREALAKIVSQYEENDKQLVIVVDEQSGKAVLTTSKFAIAAGETPFDLTSSPTP